MPGTHWAKDKGYFAAEGLDVVIDQGEGAAATVTRIMSGAYDAGFGDINAAIQAAAERPDDAPVTVYMIYSKAPFALLVKAQSPIRSVKDLAGKKIGGPAGSAALKLIPALAKQNGLDPGKVEFTNMAPNLQEQMLIRGQVDVVRDLHGDELHEPRRAQARSRQGFPLDQLCRCRPRPLFHAA